MTYRIAGLDPAQFAPLWSMDAAEGSLAEPRLAGPGEADAAIRGPLSNPEVAFIDAHNAAARCFAARIEREGR